MTRTWPWVGAAFVGLAVLYLPRLDVSWGQLLGLLVFLLCPLMHFFSGHRHGAHGGGDSGERKSPVLESREIK